MLLDYTSTQAVADWLRGITDNQGRHCSGDEKQRVYRLLLQFERAAWIPRLFLLIMQNLSGPGRFVESEKGVQFESGERSGLDTCRAISNLLTAYLSMMNSLEMEDTLLNTEEAAAYLQMTPDGIRWYVYKVEEPHRLKPDKIMQRALIFRKSTLDHFQETQRLSGGHRKQSDTR